MALDERMRAVLELTYSDRGMDAATRDAEQLRAALDRVGREADRLSSSSRRAIRVAPELQADLDAASQRTSRKLETTGWRYDEWALKTEDRWQAQQAKAREQAAKAAAAAEAASAKAAAREREQAARRATLEAHRAASAQMQAARFAASEARQAAAETRRAAKEQERAAKVAATETRRAAREAERAQLLASRQTRGVNRADAQGLDALLRVAGRKGAEGEISAVRQLTGAWGGYASASAVAIGGATALGAAMARGAYEIGNQGEQLDQTTKRLVAFSGNAARAADTVISVRDATEGAATAMDGMRMSSQLMSMGIAQDAEQAAQIMRMAVMLGAPSRTADDKVQDFTALLANNSVRRLDQFGISVDQVREKMVKMRAENANLSKEQAFVNAVIEVGTARVNELADAGARAATSQQQLASAWTNYWQNVGAAVLAGPLSDVQRWFAGNLERSNARNQIRAEDPAVRMIGLQTGIRLNEELIAKEDRLTHASLQRVHKIEETNRLLKQQLDLLRAAATAGQSNDAGVGTYRVQREALLDLAEAMRVTTDEASFLRRFLGKGEKSYVLNLGAQGQILPQDELDAVRGRAKVAFGELKANYLDFVAAGGAMPTDRGFEAYLVRVAGITETEAKRIIKWLRVIDRTDAKVDMDIPTAEFVSGLEQIGSTLRQLELPQLPELGDNLLTIDFAAIRAYLDASGGMSEADQLAADGKRALVDAMEEEQRKLFASIMATDDYEAALLALAQALYGPNAGIQDLAANLDELPGYMRAGIDEARTLAEAIEEIRAAADGPITVSVRMSMEEEMQQRINGAALSLLDAGWSPAQVANWQKSATQQGRMAMNALPEDMDPFTASLRLEGVVKPFEDAADSIRNAGKEAEAAAKRAASEFEAKVKAAGAALTGKIESALTARADKVTPQEMALSKVGLYEDAPMENARRLNAIMERGKAELKAHPDWEGILGIPPEVLADTEDVLKAWAAKTSEDVQNFLRPDLIDWDAFVREFQTGEERITAKKRTIELAVQALRDAGKLPGMDQLTAEKEVGDYLGLVPEWGGGKLNASIQEGLRSELDMYGFTNNLKGALDADMKANADVLETAGKSYGGTLVGAISKGVADNIGAVRHQIAVAIAPEVAAILNARRPANTGAAPLD